MWEKHQAMHPPRAPNGTLHRKWKTAAWPFSRLWRLSDPTLFQVTLVIALLATVLGDCGPPPNLLFASPINELNETDFEAGTILKYNCRPGYSKTSSKNSLTCQHGGVWKYTPFCTKKRCRNPGELHNGQISKTDLSFGSRIEFSCSDGYILIGSTTSYCDIQDKGVDWSDPLPVCVIAKCEAPPTISNGKHSGGDEDVYTYGSSVTYSCDPHFSMIGKASISCTVENKTIGVWSPSPPTCKHVVCHKPQVPNGIFVSGFGPLYTYKDAIVLDCKKGYVLTGSSLIHCEADNNWDPPPPVCELNGCTNLPDIPNAFWERYRYQRPTKEDVYNVGTVLKYHCLTGYKPASDKPTAVICQEDFRWTPYTECEEVCCPVPELKNGEIFSQRRRASTSSCVYSSGEKITYSCFKKKEFSATCQKDGTWHPKTPVCDDCIFPATIDHGHYKEVNGFWTNEVLYECDEGYSLVGQARLSCNSSGWSSPAPQCKALCPKPQIEHGRLSVVKDQYITPENVTIQCDPHYRLVGLQSITCSENSTWYPEVPMCEWEIAEGCEQVLAGRKIMQCLPKPEDVRTALELYKLSLEIKQLEKKLEKEEKCTPEVQE